MEKQNYISEVDIIEEAKETFLTYAEEVLTDRAIPSVEDGLLSAQRKILWTMEDYLKWMPRVRLKSVMRLSVLLLPHLISMAMPLVMEFYVKCRRSF